MTNSHRLLKYLEISAFGHYIKSLSIAVPLFVFTYLSADLPKDIINHGILSKNFQVIMLGRVSYTQIEYLMVMCSMLLGIGAVIIALRWLTRWQQQKFGAEVTEAMVRAASNAEAPPQLMLRNIEYAEAFDDLHTRYAPTLAQPMLIGTVVIALVMFAFLQDPVLGIASIITFPIRSLFARRMQKRLSAVWVPRSADAASLRGFVLRTTRTGQFDLFSRYGTLFLMLSLGGYLVIEGALTFGALVAVMIAVPEIDILMQQLAEWFETNAYAQSAYGRFLSTFGPDEEPQAGALAARRS